MVKCNIYSLRSRADIRESQLLILSMILRRYTGGLYRLYTTVASSARILTIMRSHVDFIFDWYADITQPSRAAASFQIANISVVRKYSSSNLGMDKYALDLVLSAS